MKCRGGWIGAAAALVLILLGITGVIRWIAGDAASMAHAMLRFAPPERTGLPEAEYAGVAEMLTGFLTGRRTEFQYTWTGPQGETLLAFHDYEAAHMADCRALIRLDGAVCVGCGALALLLPAGFMFMTRREKRRDWVPFLRGGLRAWWGLTGILLALGIWACADFESLFLLFHRVAFRNELWLLDPRTDLLIRLMPETLFVHLGVRGAGMAATWIAGIGLVLGLGLRRATREWRNKT